MNLALPLAGGATVLLAGLVRGRSAGLLLSLLGGVMLSQGLQAGAVVVLLALVSVFLDGPKAWRGALVAMLFVVGFVSGGEGAPGGSFSALEGWGLSPDAAYALVLTFRKTVHFTAYGLLAVAAAQAYRAGDARRFGVPFALVVASFDEARQAFVTSRSGSAWDVLLDGAGALLGTFLLMRAREPRTVEE